MSMKLVATIPDTREVISPESHLNSLRVGVIQTQMNILHNQLQSIIQRGLDGEVLDLSTLANAEQNLDNAMYWLKRI